MAVAGEGIERDVAEHADIREFLFDRAHRLADQIVRVERLGALLVAQRRLGIGEQRDAGDVEFCRALGLAHHLVDGEAIDPGHRGNRCAGVVAVDHEHRPDQVVGREHVLAHQPPSPFRFTVAARADREIERGRREGGGPPRRIAHFDRTAELDRHLIAPRRQAGSGLDISPILAPCIPAVTARPVQTRYFGRRPLTALARAVRTMRPVLSAGTCSRTAAFNLATSAEVIAATAGPMEGPFKLMAQKSSKSVNVRCTVISLVSTPSSPARDHSSCIVAICEAAICGGRVGDSPIARISARTGSNGNPPPSMSHIYVAAMAPEPSTLTISAIPLRGSGTKTRTSAITAASNRPSPNGIAMASPRRNFAVRAPRRPRAYSS